MIMTKKSRDRRKAFRFIKCTVGRINASFFKDDFNNFLLFGSTGHFEVRLKEVAYWKANK